MTNDDNPMADAPEWAKALNDRIDDLVSEEKDAGAGDAPMADAPEWAKNLDERINEIEEKALDDDGEDKTRVGEEPRGAHRRDLEADRYRLAADREGRERREREGRRLHAGPAEGSR